jgi:VCBS repeat-containing protein
LGGTGNDYTRGIAVDESGNLFVAGYTNSQDLPNPTNGFQGGTQDTFVVRIDAAGDVVWTTYLGGTGSDYSATYSAIAIDSSQNVFVAGYTNSPDLAQRINDYQGGTYDSFVAKLNSGGAVAWTMYLGGSDSDYARGITVDSPGNVLVGGYTLSGNLPNATNVNHGGIDGYVAKIGGAGSVQWTTYLGGSEDDYANAVATSGSGDVLVTGYSYAAAIGGRDATLTKLDSDTGHVALMAYLGGTGDDLGQSVATDGEGRVYVAGITYSTDLPGASNSLQGDRDGFLVKLDPANIAPPPAEPPVALADNYSVNWNRTLQIAALGVLANDSDPNEDALTAVLVDGGGPSNGTLTLNADGSFSYTPAAGYVGTDTFSYQAFDGALFSAIATVTIQVLNQAPVAVSDSYTTPFQTQLVVGVPGLLANDSDPNEDALTAVLVDGGGPSYGTLTLNADGSFSYTPAAGYVGTDTFSYQAFDGELYSAIATVTIDVQPGEVTLVYSNTTPKTIKDRAKTTSTISVPDAMSIVDVNVQLTISHTRDQDLDVYLIAPDGTRVELFTDVGGNGDHFTGTVLDSQASTSITAGSAPFASTYRPEGSLSVLNNKNALGTWTLEITDDQLLYSGTLTSWSITVTGEPMALAAAAPTGTGGDVAPLTQLDAQRAVAQTLQWWSTYAHAQTSAPIHVYVSDLPQGLLGLAWGQSLTLDVNANGLGWFIDSTPWDHSEFAVGRAPATQRMDLLTVVAHEIGHLFGANHSDNSADLMADTLPPGTRRLPGAAQLHSRANRIVPCVTPVSLESMLDLQPRQCVSVPVASPDSADWNDLLEPIAVARAQQIDTADEMRRARLHVDALDGVMAELADDLLELLM